MRRESGCDRGLAYLVLGVVLSGVEQPSGASEASVEPSDERRIVPASTCDVTVSARRRMSYRGRAEQAVDRGSSREGYSSRPGIVSRKRGSTGPSVVTLTSRASTTLSVSPASMRDRWPPASAARARVSEPSAGDALGSLRWQRGRVAQAGERRRSRGGGSRRVGDDGGASRRRRAGRRRPTARRSPTYRRVGVEREGV